MSSLAAARADNFYYDPLRFDPSKKKRGSANALANSHPLGERAKRIKEGILVIRFEMPYDSWCLGCGIHVARGVRFNVDKEKVGEYFTTPIYEFRMKCTACDTNYVIRTDPKNSDYEYVSGIRMKVKTFSSKDAETMKQATPAEREALDTHKLYKLEHKQDDERKARSEYARLEALAGIRDQQWADDFSMNQKLRALARAERTDGHALEDEGRARGYSFAMLPASKEDERVTRMIFDAKRAGTADEVAQLVDQVSSHVKEAGTVAEKDLLEPVLSGFVRSSATSEKLARINTAAQPLFAAPVESDAPPSFKEVRSPPTDDAKSSVASLATSNSLNKHLKRVRLQQETLSKIARARLNPTELTVAAPLPASGAALPPTGIMGALAGKMATPAARGAPSLRPTTAPHGPRSVSSAGSIRAPRATDLLLGAATKPGARSATPPVRIKAR